MLLAPADKATQQLLRVVISSALAHSQHTVSNAQINASTTELSVSHPTNCSLFAGNRFLLIVHDTHAHTHTCR